MPPFMKNLTNVTPLVCITFACLLLTFVLLPWTSPVTVKTYVDKHTGRKRVSFQCGVVLSDKVYETRFATLWQANLGQFPAPEWSTVSAYKWPFGNRTPDFGLLGVFDWQDTIVTAIETCPFDKNTRSVVLSNFVLHI